MVGRELALLRRVETFRDGRISFPSVLAYNYFDVAFQ